MEISVPAVEALRAYLTLDAGRMNELADGCGADYEVLSGAAFYLLPAQRRQPRGRGGVVRRRRG